MIRNKSVDSGIVEVENAVDLEQFKKSTVTVLRRIDAEIGYLWGEVNNLNRM